MPIRILASKWENGKAPNCVINNLALRIVVASLRILPKPSDLAQEGPNDKPRQERIAQGRSAQKGKILDKFVAATDCH